MSKTFCVALKYYDKFEYSTALMERLTEILDDFFASDEIEMCPHCEKIFLKSENALQYEQPDGDYTCDCLSPENQASDMADDWVKESKEQ